MGKTRTAFISETPDEKTSGKAKYKEKKRKQKEQRDKEALKKKQVGKVGLKGGERIKIVGADITDALQKEPSDTKAMEGKEKGVRPPRKRGKKYTESQALVDKTKLYPLTDAIKLVKKTSYSKFDGTVELHLVVKKLGTTVNVSLPYSAGKKKKVEVADKKTLEKLKKGKIDFDVLLATAEMMPRLVPFAKLLGPKGLMPNPKTGTLIKNIKDVDKFSGNSITLKTERGVPVIHTTVGKVSQKEKELAENTVSILEAFGKRQIRKAYLTSTMGPSIKLEVLKIEKVN